MAICHQNNGSIIMIDLSQLLLGANQQYYCRPRPADRLEAPGNNWLPHPHVCIESGAIYFARRSRCNMHVLFGCPSKVLPATFASSRFQRFEMGQFGGCLYANMLRRAKTAHVSCACFCVCSIGCRRRRRCCPDFAG